MDAYKTEAKKFTLNLDDTGYGPKGEQSLSAWREECLRNLNSGKESFAAWQHSWSSEVKNDLLKKNFNLNKNFDLKTELEIHEPYSLDFSNQIFTEDIDLSGYEFKQDVLFDSSIFNKNAVFKNVIFEKNVSFCKTKFGSSLDFSDSVFSYVNFKESKFTCNYVSFANVIFNKYVDFRSVIFPGQPTSYNNINFRATKFLAGVTFQGISINCNIYFEGAVFNELADFESVIFNEQCSFIDAHFSSKTKERFKSKYSRFGSNFKGTLFKLDTDFSNCKFSIPTYFLRTKFNGDVEFNNAKFSDDVRFFDTEFLGGAFFNNASFTDDAVKRLGQMKRMAEDNGQTDQALNFNALELDAKVKQPDASRIFKVFTWLYKNVADYGQSFAKPIFLYGVLICLSVLFAMIYSTYSDSPAAAQQVLCRPIEGQPPPLKLPYGRAVFEYAMFRAGGLMDFTDTGKQNNAVNCRLFEEPIEPPLMRAWGIFKGIASIALLFLAALGLRNKYRIK